MHCAFRASLRSPLTLSPQSSYQRDNRAVVDAARESSEVFARKFLLTRLFDEILNHGQLHGTYRTLRSEI